MSNAIELDESITMRVPRGTSLALERAAIGAHSRPGQLLGRVTRKRLRPCSERRT